MRVPAAGVLFSRTVLADGSGRLPLLVATGPGPAVVRSWIRGKTALVILRDGDLVQWGLDHPHDAELSR